MFAFNFSSLKPKFLTFSQPDPRYTGPTISLPAVPIHDTETISSNGVADKRLRTLTHLLKLNHINFAILFNHRRFHNHAPHLLGSAYILGASATHLNSIYESEAKSGLVPWEDSPSEISRTDWRDFLSQREYQRAFVDFFEDEVVRHGYDWKEVVKKYVFEGKDPLVNNLATAGLGHPLIHLGYAFELNSREVAMEALGLATTNYNAWHKYLDEPRYSQHPKRYSTTDFREVVDRVAADKRLDGIFQAPGGDNLSAVFEEHEDVLLEHWNAWEVDLKDPRAQFERIQETVTAILISAAHTPYPSESEQTLPTSNPAPIHKYDFFLLHLLTTTHALRILLPSLPPQHHIPLLRQHLLLTLAMYISQLRPPVDIPTHILSYNTQGRDWEWCRARALTGEHALDAHYVKGVRAIRVAGEDWGGEFWEKSLVRFAGEFDGWGGFGAVGEMEGEGDGDGDGDGEGRWEVREREKREERRLNGGK